MPEMSYWQALSLLLAVALSALLSYQILHSRRPPTAVIAWLVFVVFVPYLGAALWVLIGARKLRRERNQRLRFSPQVGAVADVRGLGRMVARIGGTPVVGGNRVRLATTGGAAHADLLALIASAESELHVLVYDIASDRAGRAVLEAFRAAAARGVRVRVLVDDIGSWFLRSAEVRRLREAGGEIMRFKPFANALIQRIANLRNHRKLVVADRRRAWAGGRNIANPYLDDANAWMDLSFVVEGPLALAYDDVFRADWAFASGSAVGGSKAVTVGDATLTPAIANVDAQLLASGPDLRDDVWHAALLKACYNAEQRLWLVSPYFVPDEALVCALIAAVRSGVDLRIYVPERSDNKLVDLVAASYLRDLARKGIKVYRYGSGMLHAKAVLVDHNLAIIGSANLDPRSFFLNYEVTALFFNVEVAEQLAAYLQFLEARCSSKGFRAIGVLGETVAAAARILGPML